MNLVSAETTGTGFLRLVTPELEINRQLREQCLNGVVTGIQTTLTSQEFILIQVYTLKAVGYCSKK